MTDLIPAIHALCDALANKGCNAVVIQLPLQGFDAFVTEVRRIHWTSPGHAFDRDSASFHMITAAGVGVRIDKAREWTP